MANLTSESKYQAALLLNNQTFALTRLLARRRKARKYSLNKDLQLEVELLTAEIDALKEAIFHFSETFELDPEQMKRVIEKTEENLG